MNLEKFIQENKTAFDDEKVSESFDERFVKSLQAELHQPKKTSTVIYLKAVSIAACLAITFMVLFIQIDLEDSNLKKNQILANLEDESAGKRLEGVYNFSDEYQKEDQKIINSLLKLLQKDDNTNVKIATIDALLKFPQNEKIRLNLIEALEDETDPLVQIKLIKSLSFLRENRAKKPLKKIINNNETFPIVKANATLAMTEIKK